MVSNIPLVLDCCVSVLELCGEPIHYKELTNVIVGAEMMQPYGKAFDQIVYSAMHNDVIRNGKTSLIRFIGNGIFCHADVDCIDDIEQPEPKRNSHHLSLKQKSAEIRAETPEQKRHRIEEMCVTCKECKHINYIAIQEVKMERGYCGCQESGKSYINSGDNACICFETMSAKCKQTLIIEADNLRHEMKKINIDLKNSSGRNKQR